MSQFIDTDIQQRLLASMAGDSLVILCGAGLSMAAPSSVSSAWHVSQKCASNYKSSTGTDLPSSLADDIEQMAEYFFARDEFCSVFIPQLIEWAEFVSRQENLGHIAIADFLGARVVDLVVSANVDTLIEKAATVLGEPDFRPIVKEDELNLESAKHAPLLKLHGCANRTRFETVWCRSQIDRDPLKTRIGQLSAWLRSHLPNRDILVVGFWTDWSHLNQLLKDSIVSTEPRSVILVDPSERTILEEKSPALWKWASEKTRFLHIRASGDTFLDELRSVVSTHFIKNVWALGCKQFTTTFGREPETEPFIDLASLRTDELYSIRRDLTGVPANGIVRQRTPDDAHSLIGLMQFGLLLCGATLTPTGIEWNGSTFRLLYTPGEPMSKIRQRFATEPVQPMPPTRTICVGAWDDGGAPSKFIQRGVPQGIIRNNSVGNWETHEKLYENIRLELA